MTSRKRIIINILATYARSLFALACGFFTSRWALMTLGVVDYGLYGVVAGLTVFIAFLNGIFSSAIGRFYAYSVGRARKVGNEIAGLEECRKWFNTAVSIHLVIPGVLLMLGYPIGDYLVQYWLTIPPDRIADCRIVFKCVCVSCFIGMANVPFNAMYVAKQHIAELTVYSFLSTVCNVCILGYMVTHPGVWLARYAVAMCLISVFPQLLIVLGALRKFPECRLVKRYLFSLQHIRELASFAGWQLFGNLGYLIKSQGIALWVNKQFGPQLNASMSVGGTLASNSDTLAAAMNGAFSPAITNLTGADEGEAALRMTFRSCKFGSILNLLFVLPLSVEIDAILRLWLKIPPPFAAQVCLLTLLALAIDETARGVGIAVTAYGRIAVYYVVLGTLNILSLPVAWFVVWKGWGGFVSVFVVLAAIRLIAVNLSIWIAQRLIGISARKWLVEVFLRVVFVAILSVAFGMFVRWLFGDFYWLRIALTCCTTIICFLCGAWACILDQSERLFIIQRVEYAIAKRFRQ